MTPRHFAWQAWHLVTSTCVSRGRCGTISHPPSFCVAGVALMALGGALGPHDAYVTSTLLSETISHTSSSHTICHIPSLSHTICLNVLSRTIFHTIFVNNSLTHIFVTHHPSASCLTHIIIFHTHFVTYHLSHTTLSHTVFHILSFTSRLLWLKQKRMEQKTFWIGKAAATSAAYRPQPRTSPLYEFCELQTFIYDSHASCRLSASLD